MKTQLVLGLGLAVLSTSVLASKARLLSLGQDKAGSQYVIDNRNIFQNAAYVNRYKDMIIFEFGDSGSTSSTTIKDDNDATPQAEGGFLKSVGNYAYGLYYGAESATTNEIRGYSIGGQSAIHQDNQIDVFIAASSAIDWGINLSYSSSEDEGTATTVHKTEQDSLSARFGALGKSWEAFLNIGLKNEAQSQNTGTTLAPDKFEGKLGYELGGTYHINNLRPFVFIRQGNWKHSSSAAATVYPGAGTGTIYQGTYEGKSTNLKLGVASVRELNADTSLITSIYYQSNNKELKTSLDGVVEVKDMKIPLTIALEHKANNWLTLRGSVIQSLASKVENKGTTEAVTATRASAVIGAAFPTNKGKTKKNTTDVAAGAGLHFGDLSIDGVIGTAGSGSPTENGTLHIDNLMTRVALSYNF